MKANFGLNGHKQNHKCQIINKGPMAKYESQHWAEMGLDLKQYHKDQVWILNNTTKAKIYELTMC
jgi:hypothetical protein